MGLRLEELAKTIDHTVLGPTATLTDVERACEEARGHHFASVCVLPHAVPVACASLRGCDVKVGAAVSFPLGAESAQTRAASAGQCLADGADELSVVMNTAALLAGDFLGARDELLAVARTVRVRGVNSGKGLALFKVVVEIGALDDKLTRLACHIAVSSGADYVESSTGTGGRSTNVRDVELLREALPPGVGVKAAGPIGTAQEAEALVGAGAGRIGTPHGVAIVENYAELRRAS